MYELEYHMLLCICLAPADDDDDSGPPGAPAVNTTSTPAVNTTSTPAVDKSSSVPAVGILSESECNVHFI